MHRLGQAGLRGKSDLLVDLVVLVVVDVAFDGDGDMAGER
jgi:hypothetical protein